MRRATPTVLLLGLAACGDDSTATGSGGGGGATSTGSEASGTGETTGASSATAGGAGTSGTTTGAQGSVSSTTTGTTSSTTTSGGGGGSPVGCLEDLSAGHHQVECEGGITYEVEIPPACLGELEGFCGLVVDMHGYTMNADAEDENTGVARPGDRARVRRRPADGSAGRVRPAQLGPGCAHAPLVHGFLADLADALPLDRARFHAMGFSQGGGMTFRLLCDHADFFASGAPIGAIAGCEFSGEDTPSEEFDILQVHGRLDAVVSFDGVAVPQRDDALAAWDFGDPEISATAVSEWPHQDPTRGFMVARLA